MSWEELAGADPDVLVLMPCGFDIDRTERETYWLTQRPEWPRLSAVSKGSVYLADGNQYFNRPGPRVVESLQILAEILHPSSFEGKLEGSGWRRWRG
jgi:iron complex transport system substrate-binding protein